MNRSSTVRPIRLNGEGVSYNEKGRSVCNIILSYSTSAAQKVLCSWNVHASMPILMG